MTDNLDKLHDAVRDLRGLADQLSEISMAADMMGNEALGARLWIISQAVEHGAIRARDAFTNEIKQNFDADMAQINKTIESLTGPRPA